jgi:hypothetical protein
MWRGERFCGFLCSVLLVSIPKCVAENQAHGNAGKNVDGDELLVNRVAKLEAVVAELCATLDPKGVHPLCPSSFAGDGSGDSGGDIDSSTCEGLKESCGGAGSRNGNELSSQQRNGVALANEGLELDHLVQPHQDVCAVISHGCGAGRDGALCKKAQLEQVLKSRSLVQRMRAAEMVVPNAFYFLCSDRDYSRMEAALDGGGGGGGGGRLETGRSLELTAMLQYATTALDKNGDSTPLNEYRAAARWSQLAADGWTAAEKVGHFLAALQIHPDNLHCIDRLAVALGEAAEWDSTGAVERAKAMLLHYSVLRGIIKHPMQRPLSLARVPLTARPFWRVAAKPARSGRHGLFPWAAALEANLKMLQGELLANVDGGSGAESGGGGVDGGRSSVEGRRRVREGTSSGTKPTLQKEGIHLGGNWTELPLIAEGRPVPGAAKAYPKTMALLKRLGEDEEWINVRVSALSAGTHITAHCGTVHISPHTHTHRNTPTQKRSRFCFHRFPSPCAGVSPDAPTRLFRRVGCQSRRVHFGSLH